MFTLPSPVTSPGTLTFTVTSAVPFTLAFSAFIVVIPAASAMKVVVAFPFSSVISHEGLTFPTVSLLLHVMLMPLIGSPFLSFAVAVNTCVSETFNVFVAGETVMFFRTFISTVTTLASLTPQLS